MLPRGRYPRRIPLNTMVTIPFLIAGFRTIAENFLQALLVDQVEAQHLTLERQMTLSRFGQGERGSVTELSVVSRSWERGRGPPASSAIRFPSDTGDPDADDPQQVRNAADEVGTKGLVD